MKRVNQDTAEIARQAAIEAEQRRIDKDVIEQIKTALTNGVNTKSKIVEFAASTSDVISHRRVRRVLAEYEGSLWTVQKGDNNASIYTLLEAPKPPVSFF